MSFVGLRMQGLAEQAVYRGQPAPHHHSSASTETGWGGCQQAHVQVHSCQHVLTGLAGACGPRARAMTSRERAGPASGPLAAGSRAGPLRACRPWSQCHQPKPAPSTKPDINNHGGSSNNSSSRSTTAVRQLATRNPPSVAPTPLAQDPLPRRQEQLVAVSSSLPLTTSIAGGLTLPTATRPDTVRRDGVTTRPLVGFAQNACSRVERSRPSKAAGPLRDSTQPSCRE